MFETLTTSWNVEGNIHYAAGRAEDAIAAFRELSRLHEKRSSVVSTPQLVSLFAGNEYNLGILLSGAGRADEAIASYRRALDLRRRLARDYPERPEYLVNVAFTLGNMGTCVRPADLPAAEGYLREAVETLAELAAKFPKAVPVREGLPRNRANLAGVLFDQGRFDDAVALYRENLLANPKDAYATRQITRAERVKALLPRLPAVLSGAARPATPAEAAEFAGLCAERFQARYAAAARLLEEAFAADPELAPRHRYDDATQPAPHGGMEPTPPWTPRRGLPSGRGALDWLRLDLSARRKQAARKQAADSLAAWLKDADLSATRAGLVRIGTPAAERAE